MTAIAAIVENEKVWIGGDSAGVGGFSLSTRSDPKVFINGEFIFGYTSSFRMGQLLQYCFTPPRMYENESGMSFMVSRFVPAVKEVLQTGGYQKIENGQDYGGVFLVGHRGVLYKMEYDYHVTRVLVPYDACGCGQDLVLGSLYTSQNLCLSPEHRIMKALEAASEFNAGVRGPFTVMSLF